MRSAHSWRWGYKLPVDKNRMVRGGERGPGERRDYPRRAQSGCIVPPHERPPASSALRRLLKMVMDRAIRPKRLQEYVGQPVVREQMEIFIDALRGRNEALITYSFSVRPDSARPRWPTSLPMKWVSICARHPDRFWKAGRSGSDSHQPGTLRRALCGRDTPPQSGGRGGALSGDGGFQLDILIGEGPAARSIRLDLPPFTLGATTRRIAYLAAA